MDEPRCRIQRSGWNFTAQFPLSQRSWDFLWTLTTLNCLLGVLLQQFVSQAVGQRKVNCIPVCKRVSMLTIPTITFVLSFHPAVIRRRHWRPQGERLQRGGLHLPRRRHWNHQEVLYGRILTCAWRPSVARFRCKCRKIRKHKNASPSHSFYDVSKATRVRPSMKATCRPYVLTQRPSEALREPGGGKVQV